MKKTEPHPYVALGELIDIVDGLWYAVDEDGRQAIATCVSDIPEGFVEPRPLTDSRDDALWYDETAAVRHASTLPELCAALASLGDELDGFEWAFCSPDARRYFYFLRLARNSDFAEKYFISIAQGDKMTDKAKQGADKTPEKKKIPAGSSFGSLIGASARSRIKCPPCVFCPHCESHYFYSSFPCSMRFN